jgi:hypothetical protein
MTAHDDYNEALEELHEAEVALAKAIEDEEPSRERAEEAERKLREYYEETSETLSEWREYEQQRVRAKGRVTKLKKKLDRLAHEALAESAG